MKARGRRPSAFIVFEFLKLLVNRASLTKNNEKILTDFVIVRGI